MWKKKRRRDDNTVTSQKVFLTFLLSFILPVVSAQQDNRCFLDGGGAAETFFIKESLEVGGLLGTLGVIGEIGKDITLRLESNTTAPLDVQINSKNLILTKPLDKEDIDGPSSVSVNILCDRLGSRDASFPIPVTVRVTDVNDNAPQFVGAPYNLNISELTFVGSRIFDGIRAVDKDQPGPFSTVEYSIAEGKMSDYVAFENPLAGSLVLTKHLDFETLKSFQVKVTARDQGSPPQENETLLTVNVQDADDQNPAFFYDHYEALLPTGETQGQKLMVQPQDIRAFDQDVGLGSPVFYQFNANTDEYKYFELNRNTGHIYIKANLPEDAFLQPSTLVVKATQFDNPDRYAVTTLTISRGGIFDSYLQFLQKSYDVKILENVPLNSVVTTLLTNRPADRRVHYHIEESTLPGGEFSVNQKGDVIVRKMLDFETAENYSFLVHATDGRKNDTANISVSILNINDWDPRFKYPQYEFFVAGEDAFDGFIVGTIEVHDGDKGDRVSLDIKGPHARVFSISRRGELTVQDMRHLNGSEAHIVIVAEDSGIPPRKSSVPVVVRFAKEVSARIQDTFPLDNSIVIVIFATVLLLFFAVIITLTIYICKHKKRYNRTRHAANASDAIGVKLMTNYLQVNANDYQRGKPLMLGETRMNNPLFHRSDFTVAGSHHESVLSRRSSSDTQSSSPTGPQAAGQVLNPLNPRSGSQRYAKNGMLRISTSTKVSPTSVLHTPSATPSIHSSGLPEPRISADPMPSGIYVRDAFKVPRSNNGAFPRHGSVNSISSSVQSIQFSTRSNSELRGSELSLQQALRDNILNSTNRDMTRIEWPRNSISRRVKKLSWEDEFGTTSRDRDISTLMADPVVDVAQLEKTDQRIGKAIYF